MANKQKIKELLGRLNSIDESSFPEEQKPSEELINLVNKEISEAASKFRDSSTVKYLDIIKKKLEDFRKDFDLKPIKDSIESFEKELQKTKVSFSGELLRVTAEYEMKLGGIGTMVKDLEKTTIKDLNGEKSSLLKETKSFQNQFASHLIAKKKEDESTKILISNIEKSLVDLKSNNDKSIKDTSDILISDFEKSIKKLRADIISRLSSMGSGNMNRQVSIGGSVMSTKYTDMNFIAGSNVTITKADNNTTKQVDITITATGGSGSGFQQKLSGNLGQNTFTWTTAPNSITIDGVSYQKVQTDGTVMWTGTTTTVLTGAPIPNFDIFSTS